MTARPAVITGNAAGSMTGGLSLNAAVAQTFAGAGAIGEADRLQANVTGIFAGAGLLTASGIELATVSVNFSGVGVLLASGIVRSQVTASMAGAGSLAASVLSGPISTAEQLSGIGALAASVTLNATAKGTLTGAGLLSVSMILGANVAANWGVAGALALTDLDNRITNSTMLGAVAGTPGTLPTNWGLQSTVSGITKQIVGFGASDPTFGLPYIDLRFSGTAGANGQYGISLDTATNIPATQGQSWIISLGAQLTATPGNGPDSAAILYQQENSSGTGLSTLTALTFAVSASFVQVGPSFAPNQATCAFIKPIVGFNFTNGNSYDFTVRVFAPSAHLAIWSNAFVPTSGTGRHVGAITVLAAVAENLAGAGSMTVAVLSGPISTAESLAGVGGLAANTTIAAQISATFSGAGALLAAPGVATNTAAALAGAGGLLVSLRVSEEGTDFLGGQGLMFVDLGVLTAAAAAFAGAGGLFADLGVLRAANAAFAGAGALSADVQISSPTTFALLTGDGRLTADLTVVHHGDVAPSILGGRLPGRGAIIGTAHATIRRPRLRARGEIGEAPAVGRGRAQLSLRFRGRSRGAVGFTMAAKIGLRLDVRAIAFAAPTGRAHTKLQLSAHAAGRYDHFSEDELVALAPWILLGE